MIWTGTPSKSVATRFGQASANSIPSIEVKTSMRAGAAHLIDIPLAREIFRGEADERRAKFAEGSKHGTGILRIGVNPEVQVLRETRLGVFHHRIAADDQISDLTIVEKSQQIFEVGVHPGPSPDLG